METGIITINTQKHISNNFCGMCFCFTTKCSNNQNAILIHYDNDNTTIIFNGNEFVKHIKNTTNTTINTTNTTNIQRRTFISGDWTFNYSNGYLPDNFKKIKDNYIFFQSIDRRYNDIQFNKYVNVSQVNYEFTFSKYNCQYVIVKIDENVNSSNIQTVLIIKKIKSNENDSQYFFAYDPKSIKKYDLEKIICCIFEICFE